MRGMAYEMTQSSRIYHDVIIPRWVLSQLNSRIGVEALRDAVTTIRTSVAKAKLSSVVFSREGFSSFVNVTLPSGQVLSLRVYWTEGNSGREVTRVRM